MTTAVVGAGPVGLLMAAGLAERGEDVLLVDPDAGPAPDGTWRRRGVMQFDHPHFFRHLVRQVLEEHAPPLWDAVVAAGCVVNPAPPGLPPHVTSVASRRSTLEGALRRAARGEHVRAVRARAQSVVVERGRVTGVVAGAARYDVDRLVVATGRAGRFADELRPPGEVVPCGQAYVSRMYRARPGVPPLTSWAPLGAQYDGYLTIAFPQDAGTLSALVVRPADDEAWTALRSSACFEAAVAAIPNLAPWTDPDRFQPITSVLRGGTLVNCYRGQGDGPAGVFFVGDAVCTTNPSAGRGFSTGLLQAGRLLQLLEEHPAPEDASRAFDAWCTAQIRPWYDDHVATDASVLRSYRRQPVDADAPLTSDVVTAAVAADPSLADVVLPYQGMVALPATLQAGEDRVRALLRQGWQPGHAEGPSRDELVERMSLVPAQRRGGAAADGQHPPVPVPRSTS